MLAHPYKFQRVDNTLLTWEIIYCYCNNKVESAYFSVRDGNLNASLIREKLNASVKLRDIDYKRCPHSMFAEDDACEYVRIEIILDNEADEAVFIMMAVEVLYEIIPGIWSKYKVKTICVSLSEAKQSR